jgi:uncharacterized protein (DUF427 family)
MDECQTRTVADYPKAITPVGHVEPVPRRIRAMLGGRWVIDTTDALYVWDWPFYPQYLIPEKDADVSAVPKGVVREDEHAGYVRVEWGALDSWFEEDEEVFVHPRNPYTRVDALRSSRSVRVELDGVVLGESSAPVMVFETGLPARTYVERTGVHFEHLRPSDTSTDCPYKGRTTAYWSVQTERGLYPDVAWSYDFPTRQLLPVAGLVAFYDEQVDTFLDGELRERPRTHFSPSN